MEEQKLSDDLGSSQSVHPPSRWPCLNRTRRWPSLLLTALSIVMTVSLLVSGFLLLGWSFMDCSHYEDKILCQTQKQRYRAYSISFLALSAVMVVSSLQAIYTGNLVQICSWIAATVFIVVFSLYRLFLSSVHSHVDTVILLAISATTVVLSIICVIFSRSDFHRENASGMSLTKRAIITSSNFAVSIIMYGAILCIFPTLILLLFTTPGKAATSIKVIHSVAIAVQVTWGVVGFLGTKFRKPVMIILSLVVGCVVFAHLVASIPLIAKGFVTNTTPYVQLYFSLSCGLILVLAGCSLQIILLVLMKKDSSKTYSGFAAYAETDINTEDNTEETALLTEPV
ncbi:hypothetical protein BLNAU_10769 [Blattamonas nauphoetae]|uniref:Uncharacterized protein n=1 Tax=Blattamonas nauphoetae TaxID=2049346 RepID=A0ABQ9XS50_9EUKA|nr:hypothetical protein BLNAU_10769 [Blattamonas nauphoetae]